MPQGSIPLNPYSPLLQQPLSLSHHPDSRRSKGKHSGKTPALHGAGTSLTAGIKLFPSRLEELIHKPPASQGHT